MSGRTRFVRPNSEVRDLLRRYAEPAFLDAKVVSVAFETDPDVIAAVLPPPLEPDGSNMATAWVGTFGGSNCVGAFAGGALNVRARYGDVRGVYCVTMPMSTDTAIIFGRELYGEPKRLARVSLQRDSSRVTGAIERFGITYMAITADLTEAVTPASGSGSTFHIKFTPRCDGNGLDGDPLLIQVTSRGETRLAERGAGTLTLTDSPYDPVADFPVLRVTGATYTEGDTYTTARVLTRLDAEQFLPYAFAKMDPMDLYPHAAPLPAASR